MAPGTMLPAVSKLELDVWFWCQCIYVSMPPGRCAVSKGIDPLPSSEALGARFASRTMTESVLCLPGAGQRDTIVSRGQAHGDSRGFPFIASPDLGTPIYPFHEFFLSSPCCHFCHFLLVTTQMEMHLSLGSFCVFCHLEVPTLQTE